MFFFVPGRKRKHIVMLFARTPVEAGRSRNSSSRQKMSEKEKSQSITNAKSENVAVID